jgi:hypothetical protein
MVYIQYDTRSTVHSPLAFPLFMVNSSYIDMGPFSDPDIISLKVIKFMISRFANVALSIASSKLEHSLQNETNNTL